MSNFLQKRIMALSLLTISFKMIKFGYINYYLGKIMVFSSLFTLLDDISSVLDDVATMTKNCF